MDSFGGKVSADAWARLVNTGDIRRFPAGRTLMGQGDEADHILLLTSGRVRVSRLEVDGERVVLAVRQAPELLGELGLLGERFRTATVTAIGPCTTVRISGPQFLSLIQAMDLHPLLIRHLTGRLKESEDMRAELSLLTAGPRVARFLWRLASQAQPGETAIDLGLGQTDLADAVGLTRQTVAVEIAKLRHDQIISTSRNQIIVRDLPKLTERAWN
jgi:CRP/FNR family cyclic AMP-dependent transcriptional regulator